MVGWHRIDCGGQTGAQEEPALILTKQVEIGRSGAQPSPGVYESWHIPNWIGPGQGLNFRIKT